MSSQSEINAILQANRKDVTWLADKTGLDYNDLYYSLRRSKPENFKKETYDKCLSILIQAGFISDPVIACKELEQVVLGLQVELSQIQAKIGERTLEVTIDGRYDYSEQQLSKALFINYRNKINNCFDRIIN